MGDYKSNQGGKDFRLPDIFPGTEATEHLSEHIQERLKGYMGPDYTDRSLTLHIISMLTDKTAKHVLESSLVEFLGDEDAADCANWYVQFLTPFNLFSLLV